ncbi:DDE_3 domain-containing protein [Trichonephila clavipes]|nr:DDE_3 domain-containing protein [Trichonephila clavipes]
MLNSHLQKAGGSTEQLSVYKEYVRASENITIVGVMLKRSDLSDVEKGMIIGFRVKGGSISETAKFVKCSLAAIVKVFRAWKNGTVQNQCRGKCGAPRVTDDRSERRLWRCVRANRRATVEKLII